MQVGRFSANESALTRQNRKIGDYEQGRLDWQTAAAPAWQYCLRHVVALPWLEGAPPGIPSGTLAQTSKSWDARLM